MSGVVSKPSAGQGAEPTAADLTPGRPTLLVQMAAKMSRDSVFYTVVTGFVFPVGLLNALVLTHYMSSSQYGQLGILFFVSGLMSVVLNLLFLRGTERQVWGASDEGVDVDVAELVEAHRRPRVLGTGLVMSVVIGVLAVAATIPIAPWLSQVLVHTSRLSAAVIWTAVAGALGSTWRLTANIGRWERRRAGFGWVWVLRPSFALIIAWLLVANGYGVAGAMAATAIGTLLSMLIGLFASRHSYELTLDRQAVRDIARTSARFAAMVLGLFVLHNGDVFFLSRFASNSQVGVYKLATNLSSIVSYAVSAFLMAWAPLEFSTLFQAAYERHGKERVRAEFLHYYLLFGIFVVLLLAALATPLVSLFSPSYSSAAGFVAITGAGYLAYGLFLVVARSSSFEHRYFVYGTAAVLAAGALAATSLLLGPPLGGYGVAIGDIVGGLAGVAVIVFVAYNWGEVPHADLWRIGALLLIGGACWALGGPVAHLDHTFEPLIALASVVLFVVAVLATGVIPAHQRSTLWAIARNSVRSRTPAEPVLARTAALPFTDRQILAALTRDHQTPAGVSARTGLPEDTVRRRLVATLRLLSGAGVPSDDDLDISEYLLDSDSITQRDAVARELWQRGVDPLHLHQIELTFNTLEERT